jgi:hypothetical protein
MVVCELVKPYGESLKDQIITKSEEVYRVQQTFTLDEDYNMWSYKRDEDMDAQFVCAASSNSISEEKAFNFLQRLRNEFFEDLFLGDTNKWNKETKKRGCYQEAFEGKMEKIYDMFNTGINMNKVNVAQKKLNETKGVLQNCLKEQIKGTSDTAVLMDTAAKLKKDTNVFMKTSKKYEEEIIKSAFWLCSRGCILIFALPVILIMGYICSSFVYCGDLTLLVGCVHGSYSNPTNYTTPTNYSSHPNTTNPLTNH